MAEHNDQTNTSFFLIVGFILLVGILCATFWVATIQTGGTGGFLTSFRAGRAIRLPPTTPADQTEAGAAESAAAPADVVAAINKGGCPACHTIPGVPGAQGQVGPNLSNIGVTAATRREGYTAEQYIRESLEQPAAFTVPDCPTGPCVTGTMPQQLPLEPNEFDIIINYLVTLKGENQ